MKNNKESNLTDVDYFKIRQQIKSKKYRLLVDLAWYTGKNWGTLLKLKITDCYNADGTPKSEIIIGNKQAQVNEALAEGLINYRAEDSVWMFPSRDRDKPLSTRWAEKIFHAAVHRAEVDYPTLVRIEPQ